MQSRDKAIPLFPPHFSSDPVPHSNLTSSYFSLYPSPVRLDTENPNSCVGDPDMVDEDIWTGLSHAWSSGHGSQGCGSVSDMATSTLHGCSHEHHPALSTTKVCTLLLILPFPDPLHYFSLGPYPTQHTYIFTHTPTDSPLLSFTRESPVCCSSMVLCIFALSFL